LQGKRALVTGSSIGLGEAIARALAAEGVAVAIHGRGHTVGLGQNARQFNGQGDENNVPLRALILTTVSDSSQPCGERTRLACPLRHLAAILWKGKTSRSRGRHRQHAGARALPKGRAYPLHPRNSRLEISISTQASQRVFESADHSGGDRTSDRAGEVRG
jgi:hypothetical protein